jgi:hypothetical protein
MNNELAKEMADEAGQPMMAAIAVVLVVGVLFIPVPPACEWERSPVQDESLEAAGKL